MRSSATARRSAVSYLESTIPAGRGLHSTTAAATTGPASGPRPASSTPATSKCEGQPAQKSDDGVPESMLMRIPTFALSLCALAIASCGNAQSGDSPARPTPATGAPFKIEALGTFDEAWAISIEPGTGNLFITEKGGTMKFVQPANGRIGTVTGIPPVAYGGQGGLGDVAFLASEAAPTLGRRTIYLTWAHPGENDARYAAMGRGTLVCEEADACRIEGFKEIWRQQPAIRSPGHFSHKIAF
jgi:glucose/arabinose dehydrogenase